MKTIWIIIKGFKIMFLSIRINKYFYCQKISVGYFCARMENVVNSPRTVLNYLHRWSHALYFWMTQVLRYIVKYKKMDKDQKYFQIN